MYPDNINTVINAAFKFMALASSTSNAPAYCSKCQSVLNLSVFGRRCYNSHREILTVKRDKLYFYARIFLVHPPHSQSAPLTDGLKNINALSKICTEGSIFSIWLVCLGSCFYLLNLSDCKKRFYWIEHKANCVVFYTPNQHQVISYFKNNSWKEVWEDTQTRTQNHLLK